uniref:Lipase domain-containing protein n=1 Tax=Timema bartmani TaxID=61472 RepID=A0A7R9EVN3_9NEOP|nr:unnamed protein product [Timema bartmani]
MANLSREREADSPEDDMKLPSLIVLLVCVHHSVAILKTCSTNLLTVLDEEEDIEITDESVKDFNSDEDKDEEDEETVESRDKIARVVFLTDLNFTLYTRDNCTSQLDLAADTRLECFNPANPTKVLIHGFLARSRTFNKTKNAPHPLFLSVGQHLTAPHPLFLSIGQHLTVPHRLFLSVNRTSDSSTPSVPVSRTTSDSSTPSVPVNRTTSDNSTPSVPLHTLCYAAYLQTEDYNVIVVDWSKPASCWNFKVVAILQRCYVTIVKHYLEDVSRHTATLLQSLEQNGANMARVHLVGHSLGAHIAGRASSIGGMARRLGRITGLDPAGPMFKSAARSKSLDKTDARFVDVIHTNIHYFGLSRPIGSADFYPYNGKTQPGCSFPKNIIQKCSHSMSHKYFTESILDPWSFVAIPCGVVKEYKGRDSCNGTDVIFMGEHTSTSARGSYYVSSSSTSSSQSPVSVSYKGTGFLAIVLLFLRF